MSRLAWLVALTVLVTPAAHAALADNTCRVVDVDFTPAALAPNQSQPEPLVEPSQMVVWIERANGEYVETLYMTQQTATYGLGNRPGRYDFNSGPRWPYGRRTTVFPVWAHIKKGAAGADDGLDFTQVGFQDGRDSNLSHSQAISSMEQHYCAPKLQQDQTWDTGTCASSAYTDKGSFGSAKSAYPPRADLTRSSEDSADVPMYQATNQYDAVSRATPAESTPSQITWSIPDGLAAGDYVIVAEVSREFDHNATYSKAAYPSPTGISYGDYGAAYRGQPSVVYKVPVTIGTADSTATTLDYAGYGDPDGLDGNVRAPDPTITVGVAGSGAERLAIRADGGSPYRLRVIARTQPDAAPPGAPGALNVADLTSTSAVIEFTAPGEDGPIGQASAYEIRYRVGEPITEANFADSSLLGEAVTPAVPGTVQSVEMKKLLFATDYSIAIRAIDDCRKEGPISTLRFTTADRAQGEVDACFIATAAYGSVMAPDVSMLRRFRDLELKNSVLGQLVISSYYTFGPAVSGVVGESEPMRQAVRAILAPIVARVRAFSF